MTPVPETRPSLLLRIQDIHDHQAWKIFLEIYQPLIFRLVRQRQIQDADAHEITQEVLLAVSRTIDQWNPDSTQGTFRGWLATVTRNLVVNFLIKQSRHPRGSGKTDFLRLLEEQPASEGEQSVLFDLEERRQIFRWAAERVRSDFRDSHWRAFWMTAVEGRTAAEAAADIGISVGLVYVSRNRVMKRLRETIQEHSAIPKTSNTDANSVPDRIV